MGAATQALTGMAIGLLADEVEGEATRAMRVDMFNIEPAPNFLTELRSPENLLFNTEMEVGWYFNPRNFISFQTLLDPRRAPPGVRLQSRAKRGIRFEASFEPRLSLYEPTLESVSRDKGFGVFGGYVIREWRF